MITPRSNNGRILPTRDNDHRKVSLYYCDKPVPEGQNKSWGQLQLLKKQLIASGRYQFKSGFTIK